MDNFLIEDINNESQYNEKDLNLLNPILINNNFGGENDLVEFFVYDKNNNLLESNYNFTDYKNVDNVDNSSLYNKIELTPDKDLEKLGYFDGDFITTYNFNRNLFNSSYISKYYIKDISLDRKELIISSINIDFLTLQSSYIDYITKRNENNYYSDFVLNFSNNETILGVNVLLDNTNTTEANLFIKLYEPLPSSYEIKDELWVNETVSEPQSFNLSKTFEFEIGVNNNSYIKGPNFNIEINESISTTTPYLNISNILSDASSSLQNQLSSLTNNIKINIDFNEFSNFVHFSSIKERVENFVYKLTNLQNLENDLDIINNISTGSIGNSIISINNKINNIKDSFDEYEYFLYYESGSNSFPKSNSTKPYINKPINDVESLGWIGSIDEQNQYYGGMLLSADNFDIDNRDYLWNNLPDYIKFDPQNEQLKLFTSMIGQHFDYLWTYIKDITNKNNTDNRLYSGISKDLIAETLKSFGIKLYTNSRNDENIYLSLLGINPDGTYLPPTGSYQINEYITVSESIPTDNLNKEVYKRIYHNLPYLLKSKGTKKGLRALINCFGIPSTILDIKEFGGTIKELDLIENVLEKFNYSFNGNGVSHIEIPWYYSYKTYLDTSGSVVPQNIEFRFTTNTTSSSQTLLELEDKFKIHTVDDKLYFSLKNLISYNSTSYIEIKDDTWYNLSISRNIEETTPTDGNIIYELLLGNNTNIFSSSLTFPYSNSIYPVIDESWTALDINPLKLTPSYSGVIQEFRLWDKPISNLDFSTHTLNPKSISYKNETGSYNNLIFRLSLGSELDNNIQEYVDSIHPSYTSSFISSSITSSQGYITNYLSSSYNTNYENYYINSPNIGLSTESNEKIKIVPNNTLPDNVLLVDKSVVKVEYTQNKNNNDLEISISPQNTINNDIIEQLGNFNIDNLIGDPRDKGKNNYPDLIKLKNFYFKKYLKSQDLTNIIRLLSYYDNSLFKMIKDFVPAKSDVFTGLVIKSHILERNKTPQFEPILSNEYLEGDIDTAFISGSNALGTNFNTFNARSVKNIDGDVIINSNDNKELYNGEFENSEILVHELSPKNQIFELNKLGTSYIENGITEILFDPLLNNVENYTKNPKRLNVDYSTNINSPSNIDLLEESLINKVDIPLLYSDTQKTNYNLLRYINPRYIGCKMTSKEYNKFNIGDKSLGNQPVIDNNKIQFAYFEEITSQSLTLPNRSNVYIKYLIDGNANITELSKQNKNIFDIQSIFNIDMLDILLDNNQSPSKQKQLDGITNIYAGGFKYEPILQNLITPTSDNNTVDFVFENDIQIINEDGTSVTSSLPSNSLLIGTPFADGILSSPPISSNVANYNNNFNLKFPITRNTPYSGEIKQRVTGSLKLKIEVSPDTNMVTRFYRNSGGTVTTWTVIGDYENGNVGLGPSPSDPLYGSVDKINEILVSSNSKVTIANLGVDGNYYNFMTWTTPGLKTTTTNPSNYPLVISPYGVNYAKISALGVTASYSLTSWNNDFNPSITPTNDLTLNPFPIEESKFITLTYNIEGDLIIPEGSITGNFPLLIKNTNIPGNISANIAITGLDNTFLKNNTTSSIITNNIQLFNQPYFYTNPPEYLYITGTIDYGYNSGSSPLDNWYFERQNNISSGSFFNKLVGSYYLSNIIYNLSNNTIIQSKPDLSPLGYEPIETNFNLKIGDLMRFWNYDKNSFPIDFENEVRNIILPTSPPSLNSFDNRFIIELKNEVPNQSCLDYYDSGSLSKKIQNFIILTKQPDETNIIINKPKREGKTSTGIVLPSNMSKELKEKTGNIIKQLKSQNLI